MDEHRQFLESLEKGWIELHAGLGEEVTDDDDFFMSLRLELEQSRRDG